MVACLNHTFRYPVSKLSLTERPEHLETIVYISMFRNKEVLEVGLLIQFTEPILSALNTGFMITIQFFSVIAHFTYISM